MKPKTDSSWRSAWEPTFGEGRTVPARPGPRSEGPVWNPCARASPWPPRRPAGAMPDRRGPSGKPRVCRRSAHGPANPERLLPTSRLQERGRARPQPGPSAQRLSEDAAPGRPPCTHPATGRSTQDGSAASCPCPILILAACARVPTPAQGASLALALLPPSSAGLSQLLEDFSSFLVSSLRLKSSVHL